LISNVHNILKAIDACGRIMLIFLDGANYLLEVYFWLILGAILLVTLTIVFARPDPSEYKDNTDYVLREGIGTEKASNKDYTNIGRKEVDDKKQNKEKIEEEPEVLIQRIKKQWALAFTIFGLSFVTGGGIVIYFFEYTFTTFFGSCMIYVGVMSIVKGITLQLSEERLVKEVIPIVIFFLNFGLISIVLYLIEVNIQPWMMMDNITQFSYLLVIYVLPYLIWTVVPSFNTTKKWGVDFNASSLLKNNLKFTFFNLIILIILNQDFISQPLLRQLTKAALELSINVLMITLLFETVALLRRARTKSDEADKIEELEVDPITEYDRTEEGLAIRDFYEEEENEYFSKEFENQEENSD